MQRVAGLRPETKEKLARVKRSADKVDVLFDDFVDLEHFEFLAVYAGPAHSTAFIEQLEAGNALVALADKDPVVRKAVIEGLLGLTKMEEGPNADEIRGAAIHFLSRLLPLPERLDLQVSVRLQFPKALSPFGGPTYTEFYAARLSESATSKSHCRVCS